MAKKVLELEFTVRFRSMSGNEFQAFFSDVMQRCHPTDFVPTVPWGNVGDLKCDGYLLSEKRLFQVYAPNELKPGPTVAKVKEDFTGALANWNGHLRQWTFVHNAWRGLPSEVVICLTDLRSKHPTIGIDHWGENALRSKVLTLGAADLTGLLGELPTGRNFIELRVVDIAELIDHLSVPDRYSPSPLRPVSPDKFESSRLSQVYASYIRYGQQFTDVVEMYFRGHHDPEYGERTVQLFKNEYRKCRNLAYPSDEIFAALFEFVAGGPLVSPTQHAAICVVLAYLFERCEIFGDDLSGEIV